MQEIVIKEKRPRYRCIKGMEERRMEPWQKDCWMTEEDRMACVGSVSGRMLKANKDDRV